MSDDIVATFVKDINTSDYNLRDEKDPVSSEDNTGRKEETKGDTEDSKDDAVESLFDVGDASGAFKAFKDMIECTRIEEIGEHALQIIKMLHRGKIEEGSVNMVGKYNSLLYHWYGLKGGKFPKKFDERPVDDVSYIKKGDRLVVVKCKRGNQETIEKYRVLSTVRNHSNKWFSHLEDDTVPLVG